jgi:hypothetical protein
MSEKVMVDLLAEVNGLSLVQNLGTCFPLSDAAVEDRMVVFNV